VGKPKIVKSSIVEFGSEVMCQCLQGRNESRFSIVRDYEGRYYACCLHCDNIIPLFNEPKLYFENVKEGDPVVDDRYGVSKVSGYDHHAEMIHVHFSNAYKLYNMNGTDYSEKIGGVQHLRYIDESKNGGTVKVKTRDNLAYLVTVVVLVILLIIAILMGGMFGWCM